MSNGTPMLRKLPGAKRIAGEEPVFIRALVASKPLPDAPATAVIEEMAEKSTATGASSAAWITHLAQLLHSMYLVTFTEKAQLGAMYGRNGGTIQWSSAGNAGNSADEAKSCPTVEVPVRSHSITVDERWMDAVTRYCHFTTTLDDVARVAMALPELLQVRWTLEKQERRSTAVSDMDESSEQPITPLNTTAAALKSSVTEPSNALTVPSVGKLVARILLCRNRVISIEEAAEYLTVLLRKKGGVSAQRTWKAMVCNHTAYASYVDGLKEHRTSTTSTTDAKRTEDASQHSTSLSSTEFRRNEGRDCHQDATTIDDETLYAAISAELRASLSASKLQALLRQMRKDTTHVEEAAKQRIAQRQLQERLLNAYEHVRSLYGPKDTRGRSAMALIMAMQQESRFEDALDIKALLSSLLEIPASGLSARMLHEGVVVAEPVKNEPRASRGVATRGKRMRSEAEEKRNSEMLPFVVRVTEPSLEPVTDLRGLTDAQLELVLVSLDRSKGSVKGVLGTIVPKKGIEGQQH